MDNKSQHFLWHLNSGINVPGIAVATVTHNYLKREPDELELRVGWVLEVCQERRFDVLLLEMICAPPLQLLSSSPTLRTYFLLLPLLISPSFSSLKMS